MTRTLDDIQEIHRVCERVWTLRTRSAGLSHAEFEYLDAIDRHSGQQCHATGGHGQHLRDVADALAVSKASASAMLGKFEERGLIERFPCRADGRAHHVILSQSGKDLHRKGLAIYAEIGAELEA